MQYISIFLFLFPLFIKANAQTISEDRYLLALIYLQTNEEINAEIKRIFPKVSRKKDSFVKLQISDRISFLRLLYFRDQLTKNNYRINSNLISNSKMYYDKYYFKPYEDKLLKSISSFGSNDSPLFLTFSKPVDNYLVAEISRFNPKEMTSIKFGKAMQLFFKFDANGFIEDVLYTGCQYN